MCLKKSFQEANFLISLNSDDNLLLEYIFEALITINSMWYDISKVENIFGVS